MCFGLLYVTGGNVHDIPGVLSFLDAGDCVKFERIGGHESGQVCQRGGRVRLPVPPFLGAHFQQVRPLVIPPPAEKPDRLDICPGFGLHGRHDRAPLIPGDAVSFDHDGIGSAFTFRLGQRDKVRGQRLFGHQGGICFEGIRIGLRALQSGKHPDAGAQQQGQRRREGNRAESNPPGARGGFRYLFADFRPLGGQGINSGQALLKCFTELPVPLFIIHHSGHLLPVHPAAGRTPGASAWTPPSASAQAPRQSLRCSCPAGISAGSPPGSSPAVS